MFARVFLRLLYYVLLVLSFISRSFRIRNLTLSLIMYAHKTQGVMFRGRPRYIHTNAYLDGLGGLQIGNGVVISTRVVILTHDYSYNIGLKSCGLAKQKDTAVLDNVVIGDDTFLGAGCIILPGSRIGKFCVIGAGSVVKGVVDDYSVVIGNPLKVIKNTKDWARSFMENENLTAKFSIDK